MDISAELSADLSTLTQALDDPDDGLEAQLQLLVADIKHAVTSYLGLRLTIALDTADVSFALAESGISTAAAASSLRIPLPASPQDSGSSLVLYATTPGAFVDLAADLGYALGLAPGALPLDGDITEPVRDSGIIGLDAQATVNQALGILIDRGHTSKTAHEELRRLAASDEGHLHTAADAVIRTTTRGDGPSDGRSPLPGHNRYRRQS